MALPDGMYRFVPPGEEELQKFISSAANQSVRPYNTNEEYLYAMKEDLAEWFKELYQVKIHVDNFIAFLQDGILLCEHANIVNEKAREFCDQHRGDPILKKIILPSRVVPYNPGRHASSFFARDNVANFIDWCRKELLISEAVMFETNDLILRKNEKNFILCLLEVARRGSKFGVPAPVLIQMEEDIEEEIQQDLRDEQQSEYEEESEEEEIIREPPKQKVAQDFKSLDEMVQYILGMCTCPTQFPMVKVSEGKYKVGDSKTLIFMRILRNHVMVRVGGGWDTLEHYLDKHDPCRCNRHKVEQKISARIRDLGLVLTPDEEKQLITRAKRDARDFKARNRSLSSLNVKQANEIINKVSPRNSETRKSREDWSDVKSQSLPGFAREMSTAPGRRSKVEGQASRTSRKSESMDNGPVQYFDVDARYSKERPSQNRERTRSRSPAPDRGSKGYSLAPSSVNRRPEISITEADGRSHDLNKTHPSGGRVSKSGVKNEGNLRTTKTNLTPRSKTPTPGSMRSTSTSSMPRRSVTPTPTVTSQRRAALSSMRSKSPGPDRNVNNSFEEKKSRPTTPRNKGPPSSYRNSETLPRNYKTTEKTPRRETTSDDKRFNSLPRPSSPRPSYGMTETDSRSRPTSALSVARGSPHHKSMQDISEPRPSRPKSALGIYSSTSNLSTVPSKNQGRKTIATTQSDAMQRLTSKTRSQSMDNLSIQRQISGNNERNMFFERLSQPKTKPKSRSRSNLLDEDVLFVERKGEGSHILQRNSTQRPDSPRAGRGHARLDREKSTDSESSSQSTQQQQPITPSDLRLRIKRDDPDKRTSYRGQSSIASSTPSPSKDSALTSSLRLSVNMTGSPESPSSRVSYSWTPDSGEGDLDSPSSGHPAHTPKIIDRRSRPSDSHLKAPPKPKASKEEVLHVVRNPEGHHQWEHTDASIEQSQEYIDMSPYKEQLSPRSSTENKPVPFNMRSSSTRTESWSSDSSALSHGPRTSVNAKVSKVAITLGKPARSSTPQKSSDLAHRRRNDINSTSSSSMGSTLSSVDGNRRRAKVTDQVRNMLFTEDGKPKPIRTGANKPTTPRTSSTLPRSAMRQQRPTTPRNDTLPRPSQQRSQSRPTTPKMSTKYATTPRSRPKTPENRRSTFTRQEKLKSWDGPSPKKEPEEPFSPPPQDKETRMLMEFERELSENKKILAQSGESEDGLSGNEIEPPRPSVEYDLNGRRIRKKPVRSKSPSNLRSRSQPKMNRYPSCESEATNRSLDFADSIADSEDFEVAMAMTGGAKHNGPSTLRSRSVDDFLEDRGPKPRKDRHENRKSRIPTPVHFNSGRKSATGVPYHDSKASKTAMKSNVEGVGSYEIEQKHQKKVQRSYDDRGGSRERQAESRERPKQHEYQPQKENIQPSSATSRVTNAEEYDLDGQECFKFGRYGNTKTKPPRKNQEVRKDTKNRSLDSSDSQAQYYRQDSGSSAYPPKEHVQNYNLNNNNSRNMIGQPVDEEPIPPPRKKGGYHRSNLHASPADMLRSNQPSNQIHSRQNEPTNQMHSRQNEPTNQMHSRQNAPTNQMHSRQNEPTNQMHSRQNVSTNQMHSSQNVSTNQMQSRQNVSNSQIQYNKIQEELQSATRGHQHIRGQQPHDRNDSGIELGTDPESPGSSSAMSLRSAANGDNSIGSKSISSSVSVFSPDSTNQTPRSPYTNKPSVPNHGVMETSSGKYYYVAPGHRDPRLHTGYDAPRQDQSQYQSNYQKPITGYPQPQNVPTSVHNQSKTKQSYYQPNQSPKPAFYQQEENQFTPQRSPPFDYSSARNQLLGTYHNTASQPKGNLYIPGYQKNLMDPKVGSEVKMESQYDQSPPRYDQQHHHVDRHSKTSPHRHSKRPNFNDFFDDNQKLKNSLNNLNALYNNKESPSNHGNAFQLEDDPFVDAQRSNAEVQRSRESSRKSPQYSAPPSYNDPQTQYRHNPAQYSPNDTPPAPPPRQKSSYRAVEKTKLDNLGPKYYTQFANEEYGGDMGSRKFQFGNGIDLQQTNDDQEAMYV